MKKIAIAAALSVALSACTSLTYQERNTLRSLQAQGITVDKPLGGWESPASPAGAGLLNILPGFGNFYLASGNGGDSNLRQQFSLRQLTFDKTHNQLKRQK